MNKRKKHKETCPDCKAKFDCWEQHGKEGLSVHIRCNVCICKTLKEWQKDNDFI